MPIVVLIFTLTKIFLFIFRLLDALKSGSCNRRTYGIRRRTVIYGLTLWLERGFLLIFVTHMKRRIVYRPCSFARSAGTKRVALLVKTRRGAPLLTLNVYQSGKCYVRFKSKYDCVYLVFDRVICKVLFPHNLTMG